MGSLIKEYLKGAPKSEFDYIERSRTALPLKKGIDIGLLGEIDVRRELTAEGWLTINTNTEQGNFPNVDLITARDQEVRKFYR
jgi:hypothetical protein